MTTIDPRTFRAAMGRFASGVTVISTLIGALTTTATTALLAAAMPAHATEGGTSMYPNGTENFILGALPPPGLYGMVFGNHCSADRVNDNSGNNLFIPSFKVTANVVSPRLAWVSGTKVLGGDLVAHVILLLVNLKCNALWGKAVFPV